MSNIGQRIGPFEIVERAQIPEMGDWYLARRTGQTIRQPNWVYVRILPKAASANDKARLQLDYEGLRMLDDPRIPGAVGYYKDQGALAIHTANGAPLRHLVEGRKDNIYPMTPATLLDLIIELCEVLEHAHDRQRHHGHLSDESVWLSADGQVHVFGFASPAAAPRDAWLSPERAQARPHGAATDQWAVGALIASLITGRAPWPRNKDRNSIGTQDIETLVAPVETQWPALGRTVRQMLSPKPAERFGTMHAARAELLKLSRRAGGVSDRRTIAETLIERLSTDTAKEGESEVLDPPSSFDALGTEPPTAPTTIDASREIPAEAVVIEPPTAVEESHPPSSGAGLPSNSGHATTPSTDAMAAPTPSSLPPPPPPATSSLPSAMASATAASQQATAVPTEPTDPGPEIDPESQPPAIGIASVAAHETIGHTGSAKNGPQDELSVVAPRFSDDVSLPDLPESEANPASTPEVDAPPSDISPNPPSSPGVAEVLLVDTDPNSSPSLSLSGTEPKASGPTDMPSSWDVSLNGPTGAMASGTTSIEERFDDATELDTDVFESAPANRLDPRNVAPAMIGLTMLSLLIWAMVQAC